MGLRNHNAVRSHDKDYFILDFSFTTVGAGNPTVYDPNYGTDMVFARTGAGVYTITFAARKKPAKIRCLVATVQGDEPNDFAKASYNASTGVITVRTWVNAAGTIGAADDTGAVVNVICTCTNNI